jgi:hypothetical protein
MVSAKKKSNDIQPGEADFRTAVLTGDAFFKHAMMFIQSLSPDIEKSHNQAAADIGELTASATMMPLAIELYLKALLLMYGKAAPKTHELPSLYAALPEDVKKSCLATYESFRRNETSGTAGLHLQIFNNQRNPNPKWEDNLTQRISDYSLPAVLQRSSSAFVTWRYLFTIHAQGAPQAISYEFLRLSFAARCFREAFKPLQSNGFSGGVARGGT